jgi:hypothetical protein
MDANGLFQFINLPNGGLICFLYVFLRMGRHFDFDCATHYNKRCPCTQSDFTGFLVNS